MARGAVRSERTPFDQDDGVTVLQDDVLGLLEQAGIPTEINDQIMKLVEKGEHLAQAEMTEEGRAALARAVLEIKLAAAE